MSTKVPQHVIEEATRRGIVKGATVLCITAINKNDGDMGVVQDPDRWRYNADGCSPWIQAGYDNSGDALFILHNGRWSEVITPAPQSEGLKEGDAVECGPAMRAAIIELAKELGIETSSAEDGLPVLLWYNGRFTSTYPDNRTAKQKHTPEAFIAKMRVTAAQPKPIKIGDHTVEFRSGSVKVGYTTIDNATVRSIAEKLKD